MFSNICSIKNGYKNNLKMDLKFFKETKILDGGMGQELLAKGLMSKGTLWSTSAVLDEKFHQLLILYSQFDSKVPRQNEVQKEKLKRVIDQVLFCYYILMH